MDLHRGRNHTLHSTLLRGRGAGEGKGPLQVRRLVTGPHKAALDTGLVTGAQQAAAAQQGHQVAAEERERQPERGPRVRGGIITFILHVLCARHALEGLQPATAWVRSEPAGAGWIVLLTERLRTELAQPSSAAQHGVRRFLQFVAPVPAHNGHGRVSPSPRHAGGWEGGRRPTHCEQVFAVEDERGKSFGGDGGVGGGRGGAGGVVLRGRVRRTVFTGELHGFEHIIFISCRGFDRSWYWWFECG
uniref:Uncharacterized protein n=1 Tax=Cacopsylla melanoneura TaxID=428564 RepID=A0A8D8S823_9HEMI